jgi:hypothetical protein
MRPSAARRASCSALPTCSCRLSGLKQSIKRLADDKLGSIVQLEIFVAYSGYSAKPAVDCSKAVQLIYSSQSRGSSMTVSRRWNSLKCSCCFIQACHTNSAGAISVRRSCGSGGPASWRVQRLGIGSHAGASHFQLPASTWPQGKSRRGSTPDGARVLCVVSPAGSWCHGSQMQPAAHQARQSG